MPLGPSCLTTTAVRASGFATLDSVIAAHDPRERLGANIPAHVRCSKRGDPPPARDFLARRALGTFEIAMSALPSALRPRLTERADDRSRETPALPLSPGGGRVVAGGEPRPSARLLRDAGRAPEGRRALVVAGVCSSTRTCPGSPLISAPDRSYVTSHGTRSVVRRLYTDKVGVRSLVATGRGCPLLGMTTPS